MMMVVVRMEEDAWLIGAGGVAAGLTHPTTTHAADRLIIDFIGKIFSRYELSTLNFELTSLVRQKL